MKNYPTNQRGQKTAMQLLFDPLKNFAVNSMGVDFALFEEISF